MSFRNLQFGSFKPSQSNFKAEASNLVSLNSRSVSHWLVLRIAASTPQEVGEIRHRYNLQRREEWLHYHYHYHYHCSLPMQTEIDQKWYEHRQQILLLSVTPMSIRYSLAVLILHTEASFLNLPGYFFFYKLKICQILVSFKYWREIPTTRSCELAENQYVWSKRHFREERK